MPIKLRRSINLSTPMPQTVVAYGARLMNRRTIGWTTQDPCAEDFHWLSPYTVCGSDPINYVDLDGKKITTIIGNLIYEYINGDDGWGFYKNGKKYEGNNEYVVALLEALKTLQSAAAGNELVDRLVDSYWNIEIVEDKRNFFRKKDMTIHWNIDETIINTTAVIYHEGDSYIMPIPLFISLAHEMLHAESYIGGYKSSFFNKKNGNRLDQEFWAVMGENFIRNEHGLPIRIGYTQIKMKDISQPIKTVNNPFFPNASSNRKYFSEPQFFINILKLRKLLQYEENNYYYYNIYTYNNTLSW